MFDEYFKERLDIETIRDRSGFICFKILGEECFIQELFVLREMRNLGMAHRLIEAVESRARDSGCKYLTTSVHAPAKGSTLAIKTVLSNGGKLIGVQGQDIYFKKEL